MDSASRAIESQVFGPRRGWAEQNKYFLQNISADTVTLGKATNKGIKVDTDAPTYPWQDLLGSISIRGSGAADPTYADYIGNIRGFRFTETTEDEVFIEFHIPHDYVPGTDLHIHAHWSTNGTTATGTAAGVINGGSVTWSFEVSYAKGHNTAAFIAPVTRTVTQNASATVYQHMIAETQISAASPDATQLDTDDIVVDGVILCRVFLANGDNDITVASGTKPAPWLHFVDIHYQSTGIGTKQKAPDFYV